jgi:glycogen operon protein
LDPYAFPHIGEVEWDPAIFGYSMESEDDLTFDERDSARFVPKCIVIDPNFDFSGARARKCIRWDETIFYEAHVKGFTKCREDIPVSLRGTYAGLAQQSESSFFGRIPTSEAVKGRVCCLS